MHKYHTRRHGATENSFLNTQVTKLRNSRYGALVFENDISVPPRLRVLLLRMRMHKYHTRRHGATENSFLNARSLSCETRAKRHWYLKTTSPCRRASVCF